jgi:hypothetical protein
VVQPIKLYNHASQLYINDEDAQPAPPGYATVSKYFHNIHDGTWTADRLPPLPQIALGGFDMAKQGLREVGPDEWNTPVAASGGIYTEEMGSCTTIGFTGTYLGQLYSALYHSVDTHASSGNIQSTIQSLQSLFSNDGNLPAFDDLQNVRYFAMGGHSMSVTTCESIERVFIRLNLDVIGVTFKTSPEDDDLVKAVLVDGNGNVMYATFRNKKVKEKESFSGFGFSSGKDLYKRDDRDKPGPGGFGLGFTSAKSLS